jgi:hypothetical protein
MQTKELVTQLFIQDFNYSLQAKLETKLASLYKTLIGFHNLIEDSEKPSLHQVNYAVITLFMHTSLHSFNVLYL